MVIPLRLRVACVSVQHIQVVIGKAVFFVFLTGRTDRRRKTSENCFPRISILRFLDL